MRKAAISLISVFTKNWFWGMEMVKICREIHSIMGNINQSDDEYRFYYLCLNREFKIGYHIWLFFNALALYLISIAVATIRSGATYEHLKYLDKFLVQEEFILTFEHLNLKNKVQCEPQILSFFRKFTSTSLKCIHSFKKGVGRLWPPGRRWLPATF